MTMQEFDFAILDWIQLNVRCGWLDWLMPKVTLFAELGAFWIAVSLVMLATSRHRRCGAMLACGLAAGFVIGNLILKNLVARARPCWLNTDVSMLVAVPSDFSFPSGHTLASFIAAAILLRYDRRLGIPALCIAVAVAFSRLYLYVHFPTDVACGAALGVAIGLGISFLFERFTPAGKGPKEGGAEMDGLSSDSFQANGAQCSKAQIEDVHAREGAPMKLLVAEDDVDLNSVIVRKLSAEGFTVDACFNGNDALDQLLFVDYDVAVLDVMMPGSDGFSVVRALRAKGNATPVIFLTARDALADKVRGLDVGGSDYVVKPFSFDELIARIRAVARTAAGNPSCQLRLDDLVVDIDGHTVKRAGRAIDLTGKEYGLLEYLMINRGRILNRERIVRHVWGYDFEGGLNIVDVYMSYLRKKVDEGHDTKLIHTVRGIGYTMREPQP